MRPSESTVMVMPSALTTCNGGPSFCGGAGGGGGAGAAVAGALDAGALAATLAGGGVADDEAR